MIDIEHLGLFVVAGILLNLTPGPDVLFIVSQTLRGKVRSGIVASFGITAGCCVHMLAAAVGISSLLATSAMAFKILKWAGALYLIGLGIQQVLLSTSRREVDLKLNSTESQNSALASVFIKGFATNVLNPKVALFFMAFVPQFIPANAPEPTQQFILLGSLFNFNGLLICFAWTYAAAYLARHSAGMRRAKRWLDRGVGVLFVSLGLQLALTEASPN
jgi:threonine/homoserine/homoserine lactone efflux protein